MEEELLLVLVELERDAVSLCPVITRGWGERGREWRYRCEEWGGRWRGGGDRGFAVSERGRLGRILLGCSVLVH